MPSCPVTGRSEDSPGAILAAMGRPRLPGTRRAADRPWSPQRPAFDAETRARIVAARRAGQSFKAIALAFGISGGHAWRICREEALRGTPVAVPPSLCTHCRAAAHDAAAHSARTVAAPPRAHDAPWPELVAAILDARERAVVVESPACPTPRQTTARAT